MSEPPRLTRIQRSPVYTHIYVEALKRLSQRIEFFPYVDSLTTKAAHLDPRNTSLDLLDVAFDFLSETSYLQPTAARTFAIRIPDNPLEIILTVNIVGEIIYDDIRER